MHHIVVQVIAAKRSDGIGALIFLATVLLSGFLGNRLERRRWHRPGGSTSGPVKETLIKSRSSLQGDLNLINKTAARDDCASLPL